MTMALIRGQRLKLAEILPGGNTFSVGMSASGPGMTIDFACFGLDAKGKLSDERYMTFFNQSTTPCGGVTQLSPSGGQVGFYFDLGKLSGSIDRLVLTAAIDGSGAMSQLGYGSVCVMSGGREAARFNFQGSDFASERAMMLVELYRKDGVWRISVTGQGFDGGLDALVKHFGGTVVAPKSLPPSAKPAQLPPVINLPPSSSPSPSSRLSLSKITLEKKGESLSLEKKSGGFSQITVNLNWSANKKEKKVFFSGFGKPKGVDLDLGCFIEMNDRQKTVVQALGNMFGTLDRPPYVKLAGDDRTGGASEGENLFINGSRWSEIKKVLVYAFIYEGVPSWDATNAEVSITIKDQPTLTLGLTHGRNDMGMCAIALLENVQGSIKVTKLAEYFQGHHLMDQHYGWGFSWTAGKK